MEGFMSESEMEAIVLKQHGLRIESQMRQYVLERLASASGPFPIIGGDARTGVPRRQMIDPKSLPAAWAAT